MKLVFTSFKGGVGKTTSAINIAGVLTKKKWSVLLVDGDRTHTALTAHKRVGFPFDVCDETEYSKFNRRKHYDIIIVDTLADPNEDELDELARAADHLILPAPPIMYTLDATLQTISALRNLHSKDFSLLLTKVNPDPKKQSRAKDAITLFRQMKLPYLKTRIRRYIAYEDAEARRTTVNLSGNERAMMAWGDYTKLVKELTDSGKIFRPRGRTKRAANA